MTIRPKVHTWQPIETYSGLPEQYVLLYDEAAEFMGEGLIVPGDEREDGEQGWVFCARYTIVGTDIVYAAARPSHWMDFPDPPPKPPA